MIGEPIQQRDTTEDEPEPDRAVVKVGPVVPAVEQQQQPPVAKGNFPFLHTNYYLVGTRHELTFNIVRIILLTE